MTSSAGPVLHADETVDVSDAAQIRHAWTAGAWHALAELTAERIESLSEKGLCATYVAAAHLQLGQPHKARQFIRHALDWQYDRTAILETLIAGTHNSLGRLALLRGDEDDIVWKHFRHSTSGPEDESPPSPTTIRARRTREMASLGLLPGAAEHIHTAINELSGRDLQEVKLSELEVLKTEIELLRHELSIALKRRQIGGYGSSAPKDELEQKATSQLGQELWVLEQTGFKREGFFVEFGATDGVLLSNTYLLEKEFGWSGLLAEPNPAFQDALARNRSCDLTSACISGSTGEEVEFIFADAYGGMSAHMFNDAHGKKRKAYAARSGNTVKLTTVSLDDFLKAHDAPREIDYISVDTEGSEFEILSAFPFEDWDVRFWTIEHNFTPLREKIFDLMTRKGYQRQEAEWDDWYFRVEQD